MSVRKLCFQREDCEPALRKIGGCGDGWSKALVEARRSSRTVWFWSVSVCCILLLCHGQLELRDLAHRDTLHAQAAALPCLALRLDGTDLRWGGGARPLLKQASMNKAYRLASLRHGPRLPPPRHISFCSQISPPYGSDCDSLALSQTNRHRRHRQCCGSAIRRHLLDPGG